MASDVTAKIFEYKSGPYEAGMEISASFEGSESTYDCEDFIDTINDFLTPFGGLFESIIGVLGDVSAGCGLLSDVDGS